ncbi:MAG: carboxypeptidase regulatory-like domain-containing protein [Symploca sp. SIO2E9]|nr:carboxypeptidase regulatory-like domain-containing protein [Symploca sp. SIO2E9]
MRFQPSNNFNLNFNSGRFSERFNLNWRVIPSLTLTASGNTREEALATGLRFSHSSRNFFALASATLDTNSNLRWSLSSRLGRLKLNHRGNEIITNSEFSYDFTRRRTDSDQHLLLLKYETRNTNRNQDNLASLGWRYRSGKRAGDGRYLWEVDLGYGIGSQGSGMIASASTAVIPGVVLRVRYQEVSVTSDEATFRIELVPSLNFQQGISPGESRFERLRQQGGLLISPFFDDNNNGKRDSSEELYLDQPELLLILNNQSIESFRPETRGNGIYVNLLPGTYRLDFDPSGFPIDWQAAVDAYAVEVVAGSYTPVSVPLLLSYTISGVVTDSEGKAVAGARVEAIETESGVRRFSVTNGAGVYYLERLPQGRFSVQINDQPVQSGEILLDESSEPFQELNLQQLL